jgi:spermidine/putrescine transport system substrate-binding protein
MKKTSIAIIFFVILGFVCATNSVADTQRVKTYAEYVASLSDGYEPVPQDCFDQAMKEGQLNIYDWAAWWDEDIYKEFHKTFGIKIVRDNFANYDEMLTKFKLNPNIQYDFILPGSRPVLQMRHLGLLSDLNHTWLPNVTKNIRPSFKNIEYDPGSKFSLLYGMSFSGYAVNTNFVGKNDPRHGSWDFLFEATPNLKSHGNLVVRDSMYSVIASALKYLGYSINSTDEKELMEAKAVLMKIKPYIMAYDSWPKRLVLEQQCWVMGPCSVGDYMPWIEKVPGLKAYLPEKGTEMRGSCIAVPKSAPHPAAAHLWINFLFRKDQALKHSLSSGQVSPHKGVHELLPEKVKNFPGFNVSDDYIAKCEFHKIEAFTGKGLELRTKVWEEMKK